MNFKFSIKEELLKHEKSLHQTVGLMVLSTTGLKHLNHQMTSDYDPIKFHELNAKLEQEVRDNFSGDYIVRISEDEQKTTMFLQFIDQFEELRDRFTSFVKDVNSGK